MRQTILLFFILISMSICGQNIKSTSDAKIKFISDAPLELISAETNECSGILNTKNNELAFKVRILSFLGFNSPLQKEHFNENYMESEDIPEATFSGKILNDISYESPGNYTATAKGTLDIHDVKDERIVNISLTVKDDGTIDFSSSFEVLLETHQIEVPKIVHQKISETIVVTVNGTLK